jgi:uncharacterized protein
MANALTCPRDQSKLATLQYEEGIEVDQCPTCAGMWLDDGELEAIQKKTGHDYKKQLSELPNDVGASITVVEQLDQGPITCPKCNVEMSSREYAYCSQIIVDTCPEGCGVWLDRGEIQALEVFFERAQAEAVEPIPVRYRLWASLREMFGK